MVQPAQECGRRHFGWNANVPFLKLLVLVPDGQTGYPVEPPFDGGGDTQWGCSSWCIRPCSAQACAIKLAGSAAPGPGMMNAWRHGFFDDGRGGQGGRVAVVGEGERHRCHGTLGEVGGGRGRAELMAPSVPLPIMVLSKLGRGEGINFMVGEVSCEIVSLAFSKKSSPM